MKKTKFNAAWKREPVFSWVAEDENSVFNFKCSKCQCILELGNMGRGALTKHMKSLKHTSVDQGRQSKSAGLMSSWAKSSQTVNQRTISTGSRGGLTMWD